MPYSSAEAMPQSARVVIIGAGVIGVSIAAQLVARGEHDVVLLESNRAGSGSSSKPLGGIREQFFDETNVVMSQRSIETTFSRFNERYGVNIGLDRCGYLFVVTDEADVADWKASTRMQQRLGVDSRLIDAAEAARINPYIVENDVLMAQYAPGAGTAYPDMIIEGYLRSAVAGGARLFEDTSVIAVEEKGAEATVVTPHGRIRTPTVVVAAGAWSQRIGEFVGLQLPVTPLRRQMAFHEVTTYTPPRIPFSIHVASSSYFHNYGAQTIAVGRADPMQSVGFDRSYDDSWLPGFREAIAGMAPQIAPLRVGDGWAGLYEMSPDGHGLVGESNAGAGFRVLYAAGFSGHGVMHSPAVGEVVSDFYFGTDTFADVSSLSAERFEADAITVEPEGSVF